MMTGHSGSSQQVSRIAFTFYMGCTYRIIQSNIVFAPNSLTYWQPTLKLRAIRPAFKNKQSERERREGEVCRVRGGLGKSSLCLHLNGKRGRMNRARCCGEQFPLRLGVIPYEWSLCCFNKSSQTQLAASLCSAKWKTSCLTLGFTCFLSFEIIVSFFIFIS